MKTRKRWQERTSLLIGILLFVTPFAFGLETIETNSWAAWILGTIVGLVALILALLWLGLPSTILTEWLTMLVGLTLFVSPWVLGESWLMPEVWASCALGVVLAAAAGDALVEHWTNQAYPLISQEA